VVKEVDEVGAQPCGRVDGERRRTERVAPHEGELKPFDLTLVAPRLAVSLLFFLGLVVVVGFEREERETLKHPLDRLGQVVSLQARPDPERPTGERLAPVDTLLEHTVLVASQEGQERPDRLLDLGRLGLVDLLLASGGGGPRPTGRLQRSGDQPETGPPLGVRGQEGPLGRKAVALAAPRVGPEMACEAGRELSDGP
jgi:hypothetical protein